MNAAGKRRFALGMGLTLACLVVIPLLARAPIPGAPYTLMAVVLGGMVSLAIWGIVLGVLMKRRALSLGFSLCIPAMLLLNPPFRETVRLEWPILLGVAAVLTTAMLLRWLGPARRELAMQGR